MTAPPHDYLSTGCFHGRHDYCQSMTGQQGEKRPGRCKFCDAQCRCACHQLDAMVVEAAEMGLYESTAEPRPTR